MFDTFALLTLDLAKAYGIAIVAVACAALFAPGRMSAVIADFERSAGLSFVTALFALTLGLVLVMAHSLWTDPAAVLVSLFGWIVLVKGILLLAAPEGLFKFATASASSSSRIRIWGIAALVLAAVFLAIGFAGRASVSV
jgi:hypothetical protein